ncbi:MAG: DNA polymerase IV, partial [Bdellovibrionales bacterium]|nr:DNA polymerase IV [Bdellovibrionales bacterium]
MSESRKIVHVDMDCFYAAIEMRDAPHLKGKPIVVGGRPGGRGVVATANYEARKFGVRSAMPASKAARLCPDLIFVRPNFSKYKEASQIIRSVFKEYTDKIEPLSLDEAYLDLSNNERHDGSATKTAAEIRKRIWEATELTCSAGIAPNKFLAKVASDWKKPNGQFTVTPQMVDDFVRELKVGKIPGVGRITSAKMNAEGIFTCLDLQKFSLRDLQIKYGKWGERLYRVCRGEDNRPVETRSYRKSWSVENTYNEDLPNLEACMKQLEILVDELEKRMSKSKVVLIKGLFVKLRFHDFHTTTMESSEIKVIDREQYRRLLTEAFKRGNRPVRLIGAGVRMPEP